MNEQLIKFVRDYYQSKDFIPLHAPVFKGNERQYVLETIDSTFVSSVGAFVSEFEVSIADYVGSTSAIATVNGTAALHAALILSKVTESDIVITQALTFVATCNAIKYCGAEPVFVDVDMDTLSLCPKSLDGWLTENAIIDDAGSTRDKLSNKVIKACVSMHTFGHPSDLDNLLIVCKKWNIKLIEDAAESLGSLYKEKHTGTFGEFGVLSFNGNKILTTGGGGMILTNNSQLGTRAKHITTTAKQNHPYEFFHDEVGYNYRMPNINAALGCAQLESLDSYLDEKRALANAYDSFFKNSSVKFIKEPAQCKSNYWLNGIICEDKRQRDEILVQTNEANIMTRPIWHLMSHLPMYENSSRDSLSNSLFLAERVINLPSSVKSN